jgi:hypothetical protein
VALFSLPGPAGCAMSVSQGVMERAYAAALKALPTRDEDAAVIALGRRLARLIDQARGEAGDDPSSERAGSEPLIVLKLANQYLAVLVQLGATPHARSAMTGRLAPPAPAPTQSKLQIHRDEMAARRERRQA